MMMYKVWMDGWMYVVRSRCFFRVCQAAWSIISKIHTDSVISIFCVTLTGRFAVSSLGLFWVCARVVQFQCHNIYLPTKCTYYIFRVGETV